MATLTTCGCKEIQIGAQSDPDFKMQFCALHESASDLLDLARHTRDVIRLVNEGKPVPLGYFEQMVTTRIAKAEGKTNTICPRCQCLFLNQYNEHEAQCLGCEAFINTDTYTLL